MNIFNSSLLRYRLLWRHISQRFFKGLRMIFCSLADVWSFSLLINSLPSKDVYRIRSEVLTETLMNFQVFLDVKSVWVVSDVSTYCQAFIFKNYIIKFFPWHLKWTTKLHVAEALNPNLHRNFARRTGTATAGEQQSDFCKRTFRCCETNSVPVTYKYCSQTCLIYLLPWIAGVSYGRFMAMRCRLICQRILRTVGDR